MPRCVERTEAAVVRRAGVLHQQGEYAKAEGLYREILRHDSGNHTARVLLADLCLSTGRAQLALNLVASAINGGVVSDTTWGLHGAALMALGRPQEALRSFATALEIEPGNPVQHYSLGTAHQEQGNLDEALVCLRTAIGLKPDYGDAHCNLGIVLQQQGHLDEAVANYRTAIELKPASPDTHQNLALALLAQGNLAEGWVEYEWRWKMSHAVEPFRGFPQPQWRGEAAEGRTLFIHAEQGLGDTLQFCRYGSLAAARGLRVIMAVPKPLVLLLRGLAGVDQVLDNSEVLPSFDLHCPMLSLPLALGTTLMTIPCATSYLHADPVQTANWRKILAAMANQDLRVGLVWAGNVELSSDRRRSLAPGQMAPLFGLPGVHFFSLQKGGSAAPDDFPLTDLMDEIDDFADTAALIANLDLVISVDTAVAHLAAALGKPVWLLDRFDSEWRWLTGRRDSPWYPTLRIYRQPEAGEWAPVLAEIARDLCDLPPADRGGTKPNGMAF